MQFSAPGYVTPGIGISCFAGNEDELVVAASSDHRLFVWSLSTDQQVNGDRCNNEPLVVLEGHKSIINLVRFNQQSDTLASAGAGKLIELWAPISG